MSNTILIGKIPGYGQTLDKNNTFGKILLRDITYIDLIPASYTINKGLIGLGSGQTDWNNFYVYNAGNSGSSAVKIFKNTLKTMGAYLEKTSKDVLKKYKDAFGIDIPNEVMTNIIKQWTNSSSIRILAANDSTFTETISNNFSDNNNGMNLPGLGASLANTAMEKLGINQSNNSMINKVQMMSYDTALDALTTSSGGGLASLLTGRVLGVQFATPNVWESSSYNSTLNLFIKLASPDGSPASVLKYITIPILTLMAAGSPITINGVTYAMPLIWDVRAYGITHYKIGTLAAMTISRGSYETVFNSLKQPLLVDVRVTIVPLMQDFAVHYSGKSTSTIVSSTAKMVKPAINLAKNSSDQVIAGAKAVSGISDTVKEAFDAMQKLFQSISASVKSTGIKFAGANKSLYGTNGLGVQNPGDEIDGLSGITYEGTTAAKRDDTMEVKNYDSGYVKGFANSYTFTL